MCWIYYPKYHASQKIKINLLGSLSTESRDAIIKPMIVLLIRFSTHPQREDVGERLRKMAENSMASVSQ